MNSSRAIVATAVGGNVEVVEDGRTGLLVPPGDAGALAHAILRLADDDELRNAMGKAGQRRLATHFSADEVIRKTDALYELLLTAASVATKTDARSSNIPNPSRSIPLQS
jgi:glycosyltransferase involved in cell wall biosynthesis